MPGEPCFHCSLPSSPEFSVTLRGRGYNFCCAGCQAITTAIVEGGLENFYQFRDSQRVKAGDDKPSVQTTNYAVYDLPAVQSEFVAELPDANCEASQAVVNIDGITCAACVWLIEKHLLSLPGVLTVSVNASSHQGRITFSPAQLKVSKLFASLAKIGFTASPSTGMQARAAWQKRQKTALLRLGLAGLGMMQSGMVAVALHAGDLQGIESEWQYLLRWLSLFFAAPVLVYSGFPFFKTAWRSLKTRHLTMDVPVSIALLLAFFASVYATLSRSGDVYFDSISMFIFFLLLGRFLEQRVRFKNFLSGHDLQQLMPLTAIKVDDAGERQAVPLASLAVEDRVWVASGETFPCDGTVLEGASSADESLLSGESRPQSKTEGSRVIAGSQNIESGLVVLVKALGQKTRLAEIERLVEQGIAQKPKQAAFADLVASYFVLAVLIVASTVASFWLLVAPEKALWVTLSVLVVTCPCALSLATPAALAAALHRLRKKGVLVTSGSTLESLSKVTDVIFDKTGTLTCGRLKIVETRILASGQTELSVLAIASALQRASSHPIAYAFEGIEPAKGCERAVSYTGQGVEGFIGGRRYRLGRSAFACAGRSPDYPSTGQWLLLAESHHNQETPIAWIKLVDEPRASAEQTVAALSQQGFTVHCLSGDRHDNVTALSQSLGIKHYLSDQSPEGKLQYIASLQQQGRCVVMVGDGVNDVPVLAAADASIAMAKASNLAKLQSNAVLLSNNLFDIVGALNTSVQVKRIIRQNLAWALGYNIVALPLAAAGWVPPWAAAIGMSSSSLVVVLNALRLSARQ
ncbi:MAG TPA: heavy metal translocating P-type ATPase [Marinagarivorans sp.]